MNILNDCKSSSDQCAGCQQRQNVFPAVSKYGAESVVVKIGGELCSDTEILWRMVDDLKEFRARNTPIILVHGGGSEVSNALGSQGVEFSFHEGKRVTNAEALDIVQMVLCGKVNRRIVSELNRSGLLAVGISGLDGNMVSVVPDDPNLGFVGRPVAMDARLIDQLLAAGMIPVIAPLATDKAGQVYNVNGDTFAGFVAEQLGSSSLLFLTNIDGVLGEGGRLHSRICETDFEYLKNKGIINGGMVPKIQTALAASKRGVTNTVIVDGRNARACLRATEGYSGVGTRAICSQFLMP